MRVALFGGTFDPVHNAHLAVARAARDAEKIDRVLLIPAAVPPHKQGRLTESWEDRFRMLQLAVNGEPGLVASDLESGASRSYSIDTIERVLPKLASDDELLFLIGADAFAEIRTWHRWEDVIRAVKFIVVNRPGHTWVAPEGARLNTLDSVRLDVSSSGIREQLARGLQPAELPAAVFEYIRENRLYGFGTVYNSHPAAGLNGHPISH